MIRPEVLTQLAFEAVVFKTNWLNWIKLFSVWQLRKNTV